MQRLFSSMVDTVARRGWLQAALLLALVAIALAPALRADFLWDDFTQIVNSPTIGDLGNIPFYFTHNVVQSAGSEGRGADGVDTYRPAFMVALALLHTINGPDPFWFHLGILAVHLLVCLLLWRIGGRWLGSKIAVAAAVLFFACHPVTAEAFLWPSAISEPLAAAGLFAATLILDLRCSRVSGSAPAWVAALLAGLIFLGGLMAKEVVLTALPAITAYLILARGVRLRFVLPMWVGGAVFLLMRWAALSGLQATGADGVQRLKAVQIYPVLVLDGFAAMLTMDPVGIRHLSWEYQGLGWTTSALAATGCLILLLIAWAGRRNSPIVLTAVLTTGLMLAPIAMIATVPGWGGFGRYLYVPLAVTSLALAQLGLRLHRFLAERNSRLKWAVPLLVITILAIEQIGLRNALWVYSNQENLARAAIEIHPEGPDGWEWLGNVYIERGDLPAALECYRAATERGPELFRPRHNLAAALLYTGHPAAALDELEILNARHPPTAAGATVAVTALMDLGRWDEAGEALVGALDRDPNSPELVTLAARLIREHPQADRLRMVFLDQLSRPEHERAAAVLNPLLAP